MPEPAPALYDANCSLCGKPVKIVFKPDGTRPVYCKSCLKKVKRSDAEVQISGLGGLEQKTVDFSGSAKKKTMPDLKGLKEAINKALKKK